MHFAARLVTFRLRKTASCCLEHLWVRAIFQQTPRQLPSGVLPGNSLEKICGGKNEKNYFKQHDGLIFSLAKGLAREILADQVHLIETVKVR